MISKKTLSDVLAIIDDEIKECSEMGRDNGLRPGQQKVWAIREDAYYDLKRKLLAIEGRSGAGE